MARVTLSSVGKSYGAVKVLEDINLEFQDGEFVVLVGPSGCGKSTLLRMIAGLETISEGTISLDGASMNALEARERDVAMVFQSYALYPHLTVAQNIGFPLRVRKVPADEIDASVRRVAQMTGLDGLLDRKPAALSGGQRQRVAMGRAIIRSPKVFLFDEPLSNLDAKLRVQMRLQIRDLHRQVGATSVYVTHDQVEAMTLADRVVLLNNGDVQQVGAPIELYEKPANTFVAGFIGSPEMNLLAAVVRAEAGALVADLGHGSTVTVPAAYGSAVAPGQRIVVGIRPEDMRPSDAGLAVTLKDAELLGSETLLFAQLGDTLIASATPGIVSFTPGETVHFDPDPTKLHIFDAASGNRLDVMG